MRPRPIPAPARSRFSVMRTFTPIVLATGLTGLTATARDATAQRQPDLRNEACALVLPGMDQVRVRAGLVFKQPDGAPLLFDLYLPPASGAQSPTPGLAARSGPPPVVIFINGVGAGRAGNLPMREWGIYSSWARLCAVSGMAAIVHDVRSEHAAQDAADLLAHVQREAAALGVAGNDMCLWSCSANVRVGFPLAYDPVNTFVKAAVIFYGVPDSTLPRPDLPVLVGRAGLDSPNINGALDRFVARALRVNAPVTLLNVHNGHHAFDLIDNDDQSRAAVRATLDWMAAQLSPGVANARAERAAEREARRLVAAREYVAADRALRRWLAVEPENGQGHYELAGVLYQLGRFDEAAAEY